MDENKYKIKKYPFNDDNDEMVEYTKEEYEEMMGFTFHPSIERNITFEKKVSLFLNRFPLLTAKLIEALETDRFFITLSYQKKKSPGDPHDLKHYWHRQGFEANDVLPAMKRIANDFKAKEMPCAEIQSDDWI